MHCTRGPIDKSSGQKIYFHLSISLPFFENFFDCVKDCIFTWGFEVCSNSFRFWICAKSQCNQLNYIEWKSAIWFSRKFFLQSSDGGKVMYCFVSYTGSPSPAKSSIQQRKIKVRKSKVSYPAAWSFSLIMELYFQLSVIT